MSYSFNLNVSRREKRIRNEGDYLFECDRCGMWYSSKQINEEWTGLIVCNWCFDERHTLLDESDYFHSENDFPDVVRDERLDDFLDAVQGDYLCTTEGRLAIAGYSIAGCMICGRNF